MRKALMSFGLFLGLALGVQAGEEAATQPAEEAVGEMAPPEPTEMHKKLDWMAGTWDVMEKHSPSPWNPSGGEGKGVDKAHWALNGLFLMDDYRSEGPMGTFEGHGMTTWSPEDQKYHSWWFDIFGVGEHATGWWEDEDTLIFVSEGKFMGKKYKSRQTYTKISDTEYKVFMESDMGEGYKPFLELHAKKRGE